MRNYRAQRLNMVQATYRILKSLRIVHWPCMTEDLVLHRPVSRREIRTLVIFLGLASKFPIYDSMLAAWPRFSKTSCANPSASTHIPRILSLGMMKTSFLAAAAVFISWASAQQTVWGQCTSRFADLRPSPRRWYQLDWIDNLCGWVTYCAVQNQWYYQCLPGT